MLLCSSSSVGHKQSEASLQSRNISEGQSVFDDVSNGFSVLSVCPGMKSQTGLFLEHGHRSGSAVLP